MKCRWAGGGERCQTALTKYKKQLQSLSFPLNSWSLGQNDPFLNFDMGQLPVMLWTIWNDLSLIACVLILTFFLFQPEYQFQRKTSLAPPLLPSSRDQAPLIYAVTEVWFFPWEHLFHPVIDHLSQRWFDWCLLSSRLEVMWILRLDLFSLIMYV